MQKYRALFIFFATDFASRTEVSLSNKKNEKKGKSIYNKIICSVT